MPTVRGFVDFFGINGATFGAGFALNTKVEASFWQATTDCMVAFLAIL